MGLANITARVPYYKYTLKEPDTYILMIKAHTVLKRGVHIPLDLGDPTLCRVLVHEGI